MNRFLMHVGHNELRYIVGGTLAMFVSAIALNATVGEPYAVATFFLWLVAMAATNVIGRNVQRIEWEDECRRID